MEFPHMGKHCSQNYCNKLDFLPMKCDACGEIFCSEHFSYQTHSCHSSYKKDVQVPICPLCSEPVPTARDVSPDVTVGAHIDQFCKSEKKKIYTNRCSFKNCKKKELVPFSCGVCKQNYCLKHRHTVDHECQGASRGAPQRSLAAQAALQRQQLSSRSTPQSVQSRTNVSQLATAVQGNMSEDEALARALALSMQDEEEDRARAARDATGNGRNPTRSGIPVGGNNAKDKCNLS
ncbi:AN1-type zinc finger protein 2A [Armigeres subalbatus]|uniref:AN1-type zinc finger protein 2A n=1 Tax=Armigeres subalbatus TaxID=124917 RepID=UPI002ED49C7B